MTMFLGIDYGKTHVGIAKAESMLATPLISLKNDDKLLSNIQLLVKQDKINLIVCGLPEGQLAGEIKKFAIELQKATKVKVVLHPETLSTKEAIGYLRENRAKRHKLQNDHIYAAALILEDYLELKMV